MSSFAINFEGKVARPLLKALLIFNTPPATFQQWKKNKKFGKESHLINIESAQILAEQQQIPGIVVEILQKKLESYPSGSSTDADYEEMEKVQNTKIKWALMMRISEKLIVTKALQFYTEMNNK